MLLLVFRLRGKLLILEETSATICRSEPVVKLKLIRGVRSVIETPLHLSDVLRKSNGAPFEP